MSKRITFIPDEEYLDVQKVEFMIFQSPALTKGESVFINKATGCICTRPNNVFVPIPISVKPPVGRPVAKK